LLNKKRLHDPEPDDQKDSITVSSISTAHSIKEVQPYLNNNFNAQNKIIFIENPNHNNKKPILQNAISNGNDSKPSINLEENFKINEKKIRGDSFDFQRI